MIRLNGTQGELLSVAEAAGTRAEAETRAGRYPGALAEEMEGFAVAVAAALFGVPLRIVRGASNLAGDRDHAGWRTGRRARAAVRRRVLELA